MIAKIDLNENNFQSFYTIAHIHKLDASETGTKNAFNWSK
jgi:hypothetical protein